MPQEEYKKDATKRKQYDYVSFIKTKRLLIDTEIHKYVKIANLEKMQQLRKNL